MVAKAIGVYYFTRLQKELEAGNIRPDSGRPHTARRAGNHMTRARDPEGGRAYDMSPVSPNTNEKDFSRVGSPGGRYLGNFEITFAS